MGATASRPPKQRIQRTPEVLLGGSGEQRGDPGGGSPPLGGAGSCRKRWYPFAAAHFAVADGMGSGGADAQLDKAA
eukprot:9393110-Alexandrium_andersonii.AAC.1